MSRKGYLTCCRIALSTFLMLVGLWKPILAQGIPDPARNDSLKVLPLEVFYNRVLEYHPVVQQAALLSEEAERQIMEARGIFDPKLESTFDRKVFKDQHYFTNWTSELKIPVLINTDLKVGYEQNTGYYLNDQKRVPEEGLLYAGIGVALGQGLFTDSRRIGIRLAGLNQTAADAERVKLLNKLLFEAAKDYWNWSLAWYQLQINQEGVALAEVRFRAIKESVEAGDAAAIDSVEAKITFQSRQVELAQSQVDYRNAVLQLGLYLWDEEGKPLRPGSRLIPETIWEIEEVPLQSLEALSDLAGRQHPEIRKLENKLQQLEVEERLFRELLKPMINLNYNYLNVPRNAFDEISYTYTKNYKLGVDFSFPLLLRKERAKLQLNRIKQQRTHLDISLSQRQINYALQQAYNDFLTLRSILSEQQEIVRNYERMLEGEAERFRAGESSLFLVNQRENKLLEARLKLVSLAAKYKKARAAVTWAAGVNGPDLGIDMPFDQGTNP